MWHTRGAASPRKESHRAPGKGSAILGLMHRLTSLPILLSTLFLWTLSGALGCGGNTATGSGGGGTGGGGTGGTITGGTGGAPTGGTGGAPTGGTGGTGGAPTGGTGGTGGSELPECVYQPPILLGCLQSDSLPAEPMIPVVLDTAGTVTAVRAPDPGEVCGANYWYRVGNLPEPEVMIDLTLTDGSPLTIGLALPGFSQASVAEGDALAVKFSSNMVGFGGREAALEIHRANGLVAAVGENKPAGLPPSEGPQVCYSEDTLCGRGQLTMEVNVPDGPTVSIANGESAQVGGLLVTNEHYIHNYDVSGGCNFGLSVEYLMSAAAIP